MLGGSWAESYIVCKALDWHWRPLSAVDEASRKTGLQLLARGIKYFVSGASDEYRNARTFGSQDHKTPRMAPRERFAPNGRLWPFAPTIFPLGVPGRGSRSTRGICGFT